MDKKKIQDYLSKAFLSEEVTPGISVTNQVKKKNSKVNKDGVKAIEKDSLDYNKGLKQDSETSKMAPNKFNYTDDFQKTYHDQMEIMNGQEMNQYDNKPDKRFSERAKEAIEGSSNMGNNPEWANVVPKQQGFEGPDFGKNLVKKIEASIKKRAEQTPTLNLRGADIQAELEDNGHKPYAIQESMNEMAAVKPISDKNKMALTKMTLTFGPKGAAEKLINALSATGLVSDLPDSVEYGTGLNRIASMLDKGDYERAFHSAKTLAAKLEKKAMRDMGMYENNNNNKTPQIKESMKRLRFKNEFKGLGNALKLIPEGYKVDNKIFEMTDGNETYRIRWEGNLSEGRAVVLTAADSKLVNEDITRMKQLFGYKSQDTLGLVKGNARINENKVFGDILNKTKALMTEAEDIESAKASTGNWEEEKIKAPEATKHVQGSVSTDKGTKAPKAKEGDASKAVSQAPEAKKHVESGTSKGTSGKPKVANWDDVSGGEKMMEIEAPAAKEGNWDEISIGQAAEAKKHIQGSVSTDKGTQAPSPKQGHWEKAGISQAAEAKKHVHLKESEMKEEIMEEEELKKQIEEDMRKLAEGGDLPEPPEEKLPVYEGEDEEDDEEETTDSWNKSDDEDDSSEEEPTAVEPSVPMDSGDDDDDIVVPTPKASQGGAQLLFSPSKGIYWIKGPGLPSNGMEVPSEYLSIASDKSRKASEKAAMIISKMGAEELDEYGDEHPMATKDAVAGMGSGKVKEYGDEHQMSTADALKHKK